MTTVIHPRRSGVAAVPGARRSSRRLGTDYAFLFMRPSGMQLERLAALVDAGDLRPVVDRVFPFQATNEALADVEQGRTKGKVVIEVVPPG